MRINIDETCKCHVSNPDGSFREFEVPFFDGMCDAAIECYRYCPPGESYTREDGKVFHGESITLWRPYSEMVAAQRQYERERLADAENALAILLGGDRA